MTDESVFRSLTTVMETPTAHRDTVFAPWWASLAARLLAPSLDTRLANGTHPAESPVLAARAQQLAAVSYRRSLADSWLDLLIEARRQRSLFDASVPLVRKHVFDADAQIHSLANALLGPLPTVRGLAMSVAMLRDGSGPLFNLNSAATLSDSIETAVAELNPLSMLSGN